MKDLLPFLVAHMEEITTALIILIATVFTALGIRSLIQSRTEVIKDRLRRSIERVNLSETEEMARHKHTSIWHHLVGFITRLAQPTREQERGRLRQKLAQAGLRRASHFRWYLATKVLFAALLVVLIVWLNSLLTDGVPRLPYVLVLGMICGFYAPGLWLHSRVADRKQLLNRALPDALDLLVTCVESGLGLDAALIKVADETALSEPLLSNELRQASLEIRAGATRGEAFRRMSWRTGVEEIQNLSAIIIQTERFGTSVAKALRVMADGMRIRRMQLAEERAATVSVKMTIPLVFCIFPSLLFIILGPAIIKISEYLMSQGG